MARYTITSLVLRCFDIQPFAAITNKQTTNQAISQLTTAKTGYVGSMQAAIRSVESRNSVTTTAPVNSCAGTSGSSEWEHLAPF